jgi:hypothetical protein
VGTVAEVHDESNCRRLELSRSGHDDFASLWACVVLRFHAQLPTPIDNILRCKARVDVMGKVVSNSAEQDQIVMFVL